MRDITRQAVNAFLNKESYKRDNTVVNGNSIKLYNTLVIQRGDEGGIFINHGGHKTNTTKERINGLLEILGKKKIFQRDYIWYYYSIDGSKQAFRRVLLNIDEVQNA